MPAAFPAHAALFVAAERAAGIELIEGVRPDHARFHAASDYENLCAFVRPHAATQTIGSVVRLLDRFVRSAKGLDGQNRSENFLLRDPVGLADIGEKRRPAPV